MTGRRALKENLHQVNNNTRSDRIALFTCGSPLSTLYQTFFPGTSTVYSSPERRP
jgi:hypothetical protein